MVLLLLAGISAFIFLKRRIVPTRVITAAELPRVVAALVSAGANKSFAVFMFAPPGASADDVVNLQYSIEDGRVGLDWVLIAPRNIADVERVVEFMHASGFLPTERKSHGVRYLRVEQQGIESLGVKLITDFYRVPASASLDLITDGFEWHG